MGGKVFGIHVFGCMFLKYVPKYEIKAQICHYVCHRALSVNSYFNAPRTQDTSPTIMIISVRN